MKDTDERYITNEFLEKYYPAETLAQSREKYIKFKDKLNQERRKSGQPTLSDADLSQIIDKHFKAQQ